MTASGTSILGRYELLHEIGSGGMATVHLARVRGAAGFERLVAIKRALPQVAKDPEYRAMFLDEARLAAGIHHPNVVATLDVCDDGDELYLVMEYVEGDRLSELLKAAIHAEKRIPVQVVLRLLIDALQGLHAAHELKDADGNPLHLVHRDVSPQNVIVGVDGVARLLDFGIAKATARATVTREGQLKGKLRYMSPEHLLGNPIDRRSDIFAAGVVLWESLALRGLFIGDSEGDTVSKVVHAKIEPPSRIHPGAGPGLDVPVMRALARDPEQRFQTAADFAAALEDCGAPIATTREVAQYVKELLGEKLEARATLVRHAQRSSPSRSVPIRAATEPVKRKARWRIAIAVAAVVVGAIAFAVGLSQPADEAAPPSASAPPRAESARSVIETPADIETPRGVTAEAEAVAREGEPEAEPEAAAEPAPDTRSQQRARRARRARAARARAHRTTSSSEFRPLAP